MIDKTLVRALGALAYELGPTRMVLSFAPDTGLDPAKVMKLVSARGSRFKLTPDMRLAYNFDEGEKRDRMPAARRRLLADRGPDRPASGARLIQAPGKSEPKRALRDHAGRDFR